MPYSIMLDAGHSGARDPGLYTTDAGKRMIP